jgi:hypothetical protein
VRGFVANSGNVNLVDFLYREQLVQEELVQEKLGLELSRGWLCEKGKTMMRGYVRRETGVFS